MNESKKDILHRLSEGPVVGDGSMCFILEKRGYAKAGLWTPEAVIEYPDAVLQLHREYVRSGADVIQTASYSSSNDRLLQINGRYVKYTTYDLNEAACKLARKAADENECLVCGSLSSVPSFKLEGEKAARKDFEKILEIFHKHHVDFVMAEFFHDVKEIEVCAEQIQKFNMPMALCMRLGLMGDVNGISVEECAIRMANTGADIIGINCCYDVNTSLKVMKRIKEVLKNSDLNPYLICQPTAFLCPEVEDHPLGLYSLPEYPLCVEPRCLTRIEAHKFAREAWDLGVNYIGGCCGFEPHHIRAIAQELAAERQQNPPVADMGEPFGGTNFRQSPLTTLSSGLKVISRILVQCQTWFWSVA